MSERPFDAQFSGKRGLELALKRASASTFFPRSLQRRMIEWVLPDAETYGQYIRVQVDAVTSLHVAQVEVYGVFSSERRVGPVSSIECQNQVSMVVSRPLSRGSQLRDHYIRAVHADADSATILRHYASYARLYQEFGRKVSRDIKTRKSECRLCRVAHECAVCAFYQNTPSNEMPNDDELGLTQVIDIVCAREPERLVWDNEDDSPAPPTREKDKQLLSKFQKLMRLPASSKRRVGVVARNARDVSRGRTGGRKS